MSEEYTIKDYFLAKGYLLYHNKWDDKMLLWDDTAVVEYAREVEEEEEDGQS